MTLILIVVQLQRHCRRLHGGSVTVEKLDPTKKIYELTSSFVEQDDSMTMNLEHVIKKEEN